MLSVNPPETQLLKEIAVTVLEKLHNISHSNNSNRFQKLLGPVTRGVGTYTSLSTELEPGGC